MLADTLRDLQPFAHLTGAELETVASHTQALVLPGNRWLLRPGRRLSGLYFLTRGRLRIKRGVGQPLTLRASAPEARAPFYPGAGAVYAPDAVHVLQIETQPLRFLLEDIGGDLNGLQFEHEPWLVRFFDSRLLRRLDTGRWQRILRGMSPEQGQRGDRVLQQGARGDRFFVLREGQAVVHRGAQPLAYLGPGDFFGEDALISGARRNASVTLLSAATLMSLPRRPFLELLVHGVVPFARAPAVAGSQLLNLGEGAMAGALQLPLADLRLHLDELSRHASYAVTGGSVPARALAVFLLLQRGLQAVVLLDGTDDRATPARSGPAPSGAAEQCSRRA
jgi:CRP-like cAMP-binding protein